MERKINLTRRFAALLLMLCMIMSIAVPTLAASKYPTPKDNVADEAGVLSEATIRQIKSANKTLASKSGTMIAVCTLKTTGDTAIADYARALYSDWKLGEGVLIVIAADDNDYYFIQSTGVEGILTNAELERIRNENFEADFAAGNIDTGVIKTVSKLAGILETKAADKLPASTEDKDADKSEGKGTTVGSVIVTILKITLIIVLLLIVAVAALFVAALFNDTAAAIFRKYILRKPEEYKMPEQYYDERLYGTRSRPAHSQNGQPRAPQRGYRQQNPGARPNPQRQNPNQNGRYPQYQGGQNRNNRGGQRG